MDSLQKIFTPLLSSQTVAVAMTTGGCCVEAATLRATRVAVTGSKYHGYKVSGKGKAVLKECSAKACNLSAVCCDGVGSHALVYGCTFESNGGCAVTAEDQAVVIVDGYHSSQHSIAGYRAWYGADMAVSSSPLSSVRGTKKAAVPRGEGSST